MNVQETAHAIVEEALRATLYDSITEFLAGWENKPLGDFLTKINLPEFLNYVIQAISKHGGYPEPLQLVPEPSVTLLESPATFTIGLVAQSIRSTERIGRYRMVELLGKGGMGQVYRAIDDVLGRQVAIKTFSHSDRAEDAARFRALHMSAALSHRNISAIYEIGEDDGRPYIVSELVNGDSLDRVIESGRPLDLATKLGIIEQVCNALDYAHERGLIHRDLKPSNIILQPNNVPKIMDFGIVAADPSSNLTRTGMVTGTLSYMSPEKITGQSVDGRADIFSAGVILNELLTGRSPFAGNSEFETAASIVREPHRPIGHDIENYPPALQAIVDRALAKDPGARFAAAGEFAAALREVADELRQPPIAESTGREAGTTNAPMSPGGGSVAKLIRHLSQVLESTSQSGAGQGPGEFTRMFSSPAAPAPPHVGVPQPPAPSAGLPMPVRTPQAAPISSSAERPKDATLVNVFYATDRLQLPRLTGGCGYGRQRSLLGSLHYGVCEVSIPKSHKLGKLETPSILRLEFRVNPAKHVTLAKTYSLEEREFFERVRTCVARSAAKDAFIFVHGYNVSFENAARRTGQIAYDLDFIGAPIFYSWPSNGKTFDYPKDEANVTWSTPHFQRFLTLLAQNSGAARIHIIAHSMGNRAVCDALKTLSYDTSSALKLNHLVLAAPDIDAETFQELAATLQKLSGRITLYESSKDRALLASKKLHGNPRAGEPLLIIPGLDTIDASSIDTDFLGHSYFSDSWPLLSDIHSILFSDTPASTRFGLIARDHPAGTYYAFRA